MAPMKDKILNQLYQRPEFNNFVRRNFSILKTNKVTIDKQK